MPEALVDQLTPDGLMVLPVGAQYHDQRLVLVRRHESDYEIEELARVRFVPMVPGLPHSGGEMDAERDDLVPDEFTVE